MKIMNKKCSIYMILVVREVDVVVREASLEHVAGRYASDATCATDDVEHSSTKAKLHASS
jgi:hypothetical protein